MDEFIRVPDGVCEEVFAFVREYVCSDGICLGEYDIVPLFMST